MFFRLYKPSDCKTLYELFYNTVHEVNAKDYTPEQLNVWATGHFDFNAWNQSFLDHFTIVAIQNNMIVGFGDMDTHGYLDRLFVHKDFQGQGIASIICTTLENVSCSQEIVTHASITAKPFFEERGYRVIQKQLVERNGIFLMNYVMTFSKQIKKEEFANEMSLL